MTSKYKPHQGEQEKLRRRVGGWARHKSMGLFYDPAVVPATKRNTLASEWGRKEVTQ